MADFGLGDEPSDVDALEDVLDAMTSEATRKNGPRTNSIPFGKNFMMVIGIYSGANGQNGIYRGANGQK